ncbi:hypothetical protein D9Q98_001316 [Chlorella vulgaris]|uniref:Complex 1 LYR protein domain-containing protein n=1 Tax=Chlorella vulgaris TaxID=3077 RepID=A0A9D4U1J4_CHLVU|nr:hypothetical protein D9Q98_001316 [Chlorella vulgaris]
MAGSNSAQVLLLYRRILKAAKLFPSVKRGAILDDIKHQFREHKALSDPAQVKHELGVALRSLGELEQYARMSGTGSSELAVSLKGSCD